MFAGGSATGLSAIGAWIVRVLWPMMVARLRLIRAIVQGSSTFIVDRAVESLAGTAYNPHIRADGLALFVAPTWCAFTQRQC